MSLLQLAFTFFYIGLFTIGGGQVAITLMQQSIVSAGQEMLPPVPVTDRTLSDAEKSAPIAFIALSVA